MIVDDDYPVVASLAPYFAQQGYSTAAATNGAEALASALASPPSLILISTPLARWSRPRRFPETCVNALAPPRSR